MKALRREVRTSTWRDVLARSVNDVMNISFYLITFYYWYRHQLGIGDVVLVLSLISSMIQSTFYMGYFFTQYTQLAGGIKDGLDLLNKPCDVKDAPSARPLKVTQGAVSFCRVEYRYKASNALFADFNLKIAPGEKIGLVGRSGSGKSTLIKLLSRYYDVQGVKFVLTDRTFGR